MHRIAILSALPDPAIFAGPGGEVRQCNKEASRLFGWSVEELVGRPLIDRLAEPRRKNVAEKIEQVLAGGEWNGEIDVSRKDGRLLQIEARVRSVRDDAGKVIGLLSVFRELALQPSSANTRDTHEHYAQDILNSMSAHVAVLGSDGRIRQVNSAWERFAEANTSDGLIPRSTGVGVDYIDLCRRCTGDFSEEAGPAAEGIEDVLRGKRPYFVMEYPCDSPTEVRWFSMHVTPLTRTEMGVVVAHYDITQRKLAEIKVAEQSRQLELALAAAQMGVWSIDLKTERVHWSEEVYHVLGIKEFDGALSSWNRLVHPQDLPEMMVRFNEAVERRMPFVAEFRIVRPDGVMRWVTIVARVECSPAGEPIEVAGMIEDVTERKRSEFALLGYNRILELIARGANLHQTLEEVVRLVEEQLPGSLCSILLVNESKDRLRFGAGASLPTDYNRAVDGVPIGPKSGSCGTAAHRKETVVVTDISSDPLWEDFRAIALKHGLWSCVSVPIFSSGNVPGHERGSLIGTFALYNRRIGQFDPHTFAILSGAERLAREAIQTQFGEQISASSDSTRLVEAAHLAGVAIEREQAEHAIRESEERFHTVLDSSPSAVYVKGLDGRFLFANRSLAGMFGVPQEDWTGKQSIDLLPRPVADLCEDSDSLALERHGHVHERQIFRLQDGRELTILATRFPLVRPDGAPYAVGAVLRNITELVNAQRELDRLWNYSPEPFCVAGFDGYFKQVNPAWSRCLGWSETQILTRPWSEFVHPDDRAATDAIFTRLKHGLAIERFENRYRCANGTYRWFSWDAIPQPEEKLLYGFVRDVTEEKRLGEQFRQSQKMEAIGQLAGGIAHDFNNLLTVINGYSELLLDEMSPANPSKEALNQVRIAGQRAAELTAQLLAFSRKAVIEPKVLDINQVVESSTKMLRRLIGEDIRFETRLGNVPRVKIDPVQLEQVFINLAVNARDAMPTGGQLTISSSRVTLPDKDVPESNELAPGKYVRVMVADTGCGIPPDVRSRIFEPFYTTKGVGKGTGLGLSTVYGIVRQAGGTINVDSELNQGTVFRILLPAVLHTTTGGPTEVLTVAPRGTETVLLVEDEADVREIARLILEIQGYSVLVAGSSAEALRIEAVQKGPIDLLVTDVVMPDAGGRVLAEKLRGRRPQIKVLFMSGYTDDAMIRNGVETAREYFIQKPFTPLSLARKVRETIDSVVP